MQTYTGQVNFRSATAVIRSYAKVNLTLEVLGVRQDGFHEIESIMQTISLHDTIRLTLGGQPGIRVVCDMPNIPTDERNLAYQAAVLYLENLGLASGVEIQIEKRIPPEAGLGGGSSNAASILRGLNCLVLSSKIGVQRDRALSLEAMTRIGAKIGSDVPFFLVGGTALVRGRGENVEPLPDLRRWWLLVVKPPFGISTAWAYRRLDDMRGAREKQAFKEQPTASARMLECILKDCDELPRLLKNDLELPAQEQNSEIGIIKDTLVKKGAKGALMCGSGSAVFGLFEDEASAQRAAQNLGSSFGKVFVTHTIKRNEAFEPNFLQ
ncbi:MAG: 4-(cytidine 5'-diphospho)-2-C-methyl-D-erythritol kinase [Armatimonadota bacterium]|nr:4-(cytidine 5'-diphospho)-2-C-methyl-D-erythritol kinase [Armatimonadota bacterium]